MSSSEGESMEPTEGYGEAGDLLADSGEETAILREIALRILDRPEGEELPDELVQQSLTALTRLYTVKFQLGERWPPFTSERAMPATAVMIMSTAMLKSVNLELFELGMWQAWSGV